MATVLIHQDQIKDVALKKLFQEAKKIRYITIDFKTWYDKEKAKQKSDDKFWSLIQKYNDNVHDILCSGLSNLLRGSVPVETDPRNSKKIGNLIICLRQLLSSITGKYFSFKAVKSYIYCSQILINGLDALKREPNVMFVFFAKPGSVGNRRGGQISQPSRLQKDRDGSNSLPTSANKEGTPLAVTPVVQCQKCTSLQKTLKRRELRITDLEKDVDVQIVSITDLERRLTNLSQTNKTLKSNCDTLEADNIKLQTCLNQMKRSKEQKYLMELFSIDKILQTREKHMADMEENFQKELEYRDMKIQQMRDEIASQTKRLPAEMSKNVIIDESAIENISIKNRPMVIAEDYYNFCSNAWLDAKMTLDEKCSGQPERDALLFLNNIVEIASARTHSAFNEVFTLLDVQISHPGAALHQEKVKVKSGSLPIEVNQILGDYMRVISDKVDVTVIVMNVKKTLEQQNPKFVRVFQDQAISDYIEEVCGIGWKMAIQRPPMEFRWDGVGKAWQEVLQEPYWRSDPYKEGATVKYYIHPSLHHGGAVLVKGKIYIE